MRISDDVITSRYLHVPNGGRLLSAALLAIGSATAVLVGVGCSGKGIDGFDDPAGGDAADASSDGRAAALEASDSEAAWRVEASLDVANDADARVTPDVASPSDAQFGDRVTAGPARDGSLSDAPLRDGSRFEAAELDSALASDRSVPEAAPRDGAAAACGVPGNCIVASALPTQTSELAGTTYTLCPNGVDRAAGSCIVEADLGGAQWRSAANGVPADVEGTVGVRARDVTLVASTIFGPATCHFSVGGAGFAPLPVRIRLGAAPRPDDVVGCSMLTVSNVALLSPVPITVSGPLACSEVVLPQLRDTVVGLIENGLRQAIERRVCLR